MIRIVLAFVLCVFVTGLIRQSVVEMPETGARIAIALLWVVGVAYMVWTTARGSKQGLR